MIPRTSIKCWPVEYHAQSAVEAALALRAQMSETDIIDRIVIESHDAAVDIIGGGPEKWSPRTRETADHSLPYITAVALSDGQVTAAQFDESRFRDDKLLALVQKVKVQRNPELSAIYPDAVANIVTVHLRTGRTLTHRVDYPCGHANNPMSDAGVAEKFHRLADPMLGSQKANAVQRSVWRLDHPGALQEILAHLELPSAAPT